MEKYLQLLLKEVNTVIIPGLGTLTITNQSTGETMFMSYLKYDDGKLSTFISQKEGCTDDEAKAMISNTVQSILDIVEANKTFSIGDLGCFSKDKSGDLQFVDGDVVTNTPLESEVEQPKESIRQYQEQGTGSDQIKNTDHVESISSEVSDISTTEIPLAEAPVPPSSKKKGFFGMFAKKDKVDEERPMLEESTVSSGDSEMIVDQSSTEPISDKNETENLQVDSFVDEISDVNPQIEDEVSMDFGEELISEDQPSEMVGVIVTEEISIEVSSDEENGIVSEDIHIHSEIKTVPIEAPIVELVDSSQDDFVVEPSIDMNDDASERDVDIELEESGLVFQNTKKKKGVVFWILMSLMIIVVGGGVFIGLNFDKYKQYIPFMADNTKTLKEDENKAIKEFESNKTEPSAEETVAPSEEMIETAEETTPVENTMPEQGVAPVESKKKAVKSTIPRVSSSGASSSPGGEFHIVLATFTEKTNADSYLAKLLEQGTSSATVVERDGKFSVCFGSYASKSDATSNLSSAKAVSTNAWLLHKSN